MTNAQPTGQNYYYLQKQNNSNKNLNRSYNQLKNNSDNFNDNFDHSAKSNKTFHMEEDTRKDARYHNNLNNNFI
jgi:hypothetical protein